MLDEEGGVEGIGVVEILLGPRFDRQVAQVFVVAVMRDVRHVLLTQRAVDSLCEGRLAWTKMTAGWEFFTSRVAKPQLILQVVTLSRSYF